MSLSYQSLLTAVPLILRAGNVPNIVGEAGIGKSALVTSVATQMQAKLFTTVVSLSEKGDLAIPVPPLTSDSFVQTKDYGTLANVQFGYSQTLVDIIQYAEAHPDQAIIWFLDEFNRGTQAVQSELMNLVLQREINSLKLPAQVKIVIAENPDSTMAGFETSNYGVTAGDAAIKDRTVRLVMRVDVPDWLDWAAQTGVHDRPNVHDLVRRYVQEQPEMLHPTTHGEDLYPTPRAWQRVSDNLYELDQLDETTRAMIQLDLLQGDLGQKVGIAFNSFIREQNNQLTVAALFGTADASEAIQAFEAADELRKQHVLKQCLDQTDQYSLADEQTAGRFIELLQKLSDDGQYAIVQTIGQIEHQRDILEPMYAQIQATQDDETAVARLYRYLAVIATRNDK
jgi:ABC-type dipeptide/oligopeptide/nickel transport system ATPase component